MELALDNIQGNIIGGFNKDFQDFLFLRFRSRDAGRAWIEEISDPDNEFGVAVSSSEAVLKFNAQFKALKAEGKQPEQFIEAAWTSLSISANGMKVLGVPQTDIAGFSTAFRQGMAARKDTVGDTGTSAPENWMQPFGSDRVHALLLVAADSEAALIHRVAHIRAGALFQAGVEELVMIEGRTRMDMPAKAHQVGHEHFGFKDGVSQPGLRGIDGPDDPIANPDQGHPGQDLLWPGEFVLGYPTQIPTHKPGVDGPNPEPGPLSDGGPAWAKDGSYLVFRRLAQDVPAFRANVNALAAKEGISEALMGAKLVGRYASGCPLEARAYQVEPSPDAQFDPETVRPGQADDDTLNNNFEFGDDADGAVCPLASHIRKAYPRDEVTPVADKDDSESDTQTHRLLRRGIPFGGSFGAAKHGGAGDARGLLFQCYQRSIEDQFEFVQRSWVNNPTFPPNGGSRAGQDPIIAQSTEDDFEIAPGRTLTGVKHFVTTTGGEYFFTPSISALQQLPS